MTTVFLSGINSARYGALLNDLHNAFRMGCNEYPKTLTSAYDLAINWKGDTKGIGVTPNGSAAFTTKSKETDIHTTDRVKTTCTGKLVIFPHLWQESLCQQVPGQGRRNAREKVR